MRAPGPLAVRRAFQYTAVVLGNLYVQGWASGSIYTGRSKMFCFPGLHCYSCPSSVLACPLGSLQNILATPGFLPGLFAGTRDAATILAVLGFVLATGFLAGRIACSHLCPFGLLQDLLARLRVRGIPIPPGLEAAKYGVLAIFVILLPLALRLIPMGGGDPWFCKAVCPAGTLEAGWPLSIYDRGDTLQLGFLFAWKTALAVIVIVWAVMSKRPFCRVLCPLGAIWGLAGKASVWRMAVSEDCTACGRCRGSCPVEMDPRASPGSARCIRCGQCIPACPTGAISYGARR
jgi:ferredoxin-type protein NapH